MNERDLILRALRKSPPPVCHKMVMQEIEPSIDEGPDAITALAKKQSRKHKTESKSKRKKLSQWTSSDFLRYINKMLSVHDLRLESTNIRDRDNINRLYDVFAKQLQDKMSNVVLKEYLDWWISSYSPFMHDYHIYATTFLRDDLIGKFLSRYKVSNKEVQESELKPDTSVSEDVLYEMGGLQMLLMSRGIVSSYRVLKSRNTLNPFLKISSTLRDFSKDIVRKTMEITLGLSPYNNDDIIDFISVAQPALDFYGLREFSNISYQGYFKHNVQ